MPKCKADLIWFYLIFQIRTELMSETVSTDSGQSCSVRRPTQPLFKRPVLASVLNNHFVTFQRNFLQE
ncbi:hypothetical protein UYA_19060 [Ectopseudomonas alcaliphila JAB1]|nr:hypothetical protein UYA_19060 [Pseudomonas alcaliphila JAB1]